MKISSGIPAFIAVISCAGCMLAFAGCGDSGTGGDQGWDSADTVEPMDGVAGDVAGDTAVRDSADDVGAAGADIVDTGDNAGDTGGDPDSCTVDCGDRVCGPDGCGGSCGECEDGAECNQFDGQCYLPACDDLPDSWSRAGVVNSLHFPVDTTEMQGCFDYTPDGLADDGMLVMSTVLNQWAGDFIAAADRALILEFTDVTAAGDYPDFRLNFLVGEPVAPGSLAGDMYVDSNSYDESTCAAIMYFDQAALQSGALAAGPASGAFSIPISDSLVITFHTVDVVVDGGVTVGETGVSSSGAVISGIIFRDEYVDILDNFDVECAKVPVPDAVAWACPGLAQFRTYADTMFDIHANDDGTYVVADAEHTGNAASFCFKFQLAEATIVGLTPQG